MTVKEKASELVEKYTPHANGTVSQEILHEYDKVFGNGEVVRKRLSDVMRFSRLYHAKKSAIIAVDEILETPFPFNSIAYGDDSYEYWEQVKKEIENL